MNERVVISDDYTLLPINIRAPSFAISNNCKQCMVMSTIVLLTNSEGISQEGNGFVNRYILLCKYTTYSNVRSIIFNSEWFGKV